MQALKRLEFIGQLHKRVEYKLTPCSKDEVKVRLWHRTLKVTFDNLKQIKDKTNVAVYVETLAVNEREEKKVASCLPTSVKCFFFF